MSYLVHLWRAPVPASLQQAEALLPELRHQMSLTPDPHARALLEAIEARLPADHDPDDYWTEPPDPEPAAPVLSLSPRTAELDTLLPALLAAASEQGWVVYDGQAGEVRLPGGRVLGRGATERVLPEQAPPPADAADSPAARSAWLRARLLPLFERHGYRAKRGEFWFSKRLAFGQALWFGGPVRAGLNHGLWLRLDYPEPLRAAADSDGGPKLVVSLHRLAASHGLPFTYNESPALFQAEPGKVVYELPCANNDALQRRGEELARLYAELVLPWLDGLQDWQDLDRLANRVPDEDCPFNGLRRRSDYRLLNHHPDLLIARAVNAPDFEAMARQRWALYESDAFGRTLLPQLRSLLKVCGVDA